MTVMMSILHQGLQLPAKGPYVQSLIKSNLQNNLDVIACPQKRMLSVREFQVLPKIIRPLGHEGF